MNKVLFLVVCVRISLKDRFCALRLIKDSFIHSHDNAILKTEWEGWSKV